MSKRRGWCDGIRRSIFRHPNLQCYIVFILIVWGSLILYGAIWYLLLATTRTTWTTHHHHNHHHHNHHHHNHHHNYLTVKNGYGYGDDDDDDKVDREGKGDNIMSDSEMMSMLLRTADPPIEDWKPGDVLTEVTKLNLPARGLSRLPDNFCDVLPNLSILFCPRNSFAELPAVIGSCPKLQMVSFKSNGMKTIHPDALQSQLRWLILTDNEIEEIPSTIGRCRQLQKLMLSGNRLTTLPEELSKCRRLELVRLASNRLREPPMTQLLLPLPNLAWIALSDNPFLTTNRDSSTTSSSSSSTSLPTFRDPELEDVDDPGAVVLGRGASGTTRRVRWKARNVDVAVKTYASDRMTSDGNPEQERLINVIAASSRELSSSPFLVRVLGQTPNGSLVMELLSDAEALADPPSMESCSRDVYPDDRGIADRLTFDGARSIVDGLLHVLSALHKLGICHGDFYGHNILVPSSSSSSSSSSSPSAAAAADEYTAKLSDFGAAFFCNHDTDYGRQLERIEMRSFGIFVSEIRALLLRRQQRTGKEEEDMATSSSSSKQLLSSLQDLSDASRGLLGESSSSSSSSSQPQTFADLQSRWQQQQQNQ